jgi:iron complex outermembrane receptor protein
MYGISPNSGVGGVINIVPKRALAEDLTRFTASYSSDSQAGGHLDISRRFGEDKQWGVRFNGSLAQGDTAIDNQQRALDIGAIALDYKGERLRLNLDFISQKEKWDAASRPSPWHRVSTCRRPPMAAPTCRRTGAGPAPVSNPRCSAANTT